MSDKITRKDFLNGMALTIGAAAMNPGWLKAAPLGPDSTDEPYFLGRGIGQNDPRYYPPALTGMRGSHPGSFTGAHALRDGQKAESFKAEDTGEHYDLIVVGGGISGLSSAYFYRQMNGPNARVLILDNHDDFGGHAKRNEFTVNGRTLIGYGGTQNIEGYSGYSPVALKLFKEMDIKVERFNTFFDQNFRKTHGLTAACFFDKETFGVDRLVGGQVGVELGGRNADRASLEAFLEKAPLPEQAKRDILQLVFDPPDYLAGKSVAERAGILEKVSALDFLNNHARVHPDVARYYDKITHSGFAVGLDAVSAAWGLGMISRKAAAKVSQKDRFGGFMGEPYIYHFPDGNASIARMLVRSLIPGSAPGKTMDDIVQARVKYATLDAASSPIRIRLNSTAIRARNIGEGANGKGTEVTYMHGGKAHTVRANHTVLACWNMMIPHLCPELPEPQKQALASNVKVPITYTNVVLRNWRTLHKLGVGSVYSPSLFFSTIRMDFPVSMGGYQYTKSPDEPCVLHLEHMPCSPGLPLRDQHRIGRAQLYATPFETFERNIFDQLNRVFGQAGFDAKRDIAAITVNRWPHGYAYASSTLFDPETSEDQAPHVIGRKPHGRITIANADSGGIAETNIAIDMAHRAVSEIMAMKEG